jgi:signal transduction protein with GAF and PtsI domain
MNPDSIPVVKYLLYKINFEAAMKFARKILKYPTEGEITRNLVEDYDRNFSNNARNKKVEVKNG